LKARLDMAEKAPHKPRRGKNLIEAERDRLRAILNSMEDGIYIVGRDYRIDFMNRALRSELGNGEGQLCHEFFGHDVSLCEECQHGMGSFGPDVRREWHAPATRKTYELAVCPIHEPDGSISRLHLLRDITVRKQLEGKLQEHSQQLEAKVAEQAERLLRRDRLALLGEIAAGIAHEIRTPLGAIVTGIKLLEKGCQGQEEQTLIFELLTRETRRLEKKVSEFLEYARPRHPHPGPTSIPRLFDEIRSILLTDKALLGAVHLEVTVDQSLSVWPLDGDQMKEALLNLSVNALQSLQGQGHLWLEARATDDRLDLLVRDDGPGIKHEVLAEIFRPFYSQRTGGTGLGLAICKEIVDAHEGRISVTSIPRHMTTFRICLPRPDF